MRRLCKPLARRQGACRDPAEMRFRKSPRRGCADVAGNDQDGVIGGVPVAVEGERVGGAELPDLVFPADIRIAIGVVQEEGGAQLLGQQRGRLVVDPHPSFFEHDVALGRHDLVVEDKAGHAVGFEPHHQIQPVAGDGFVSRRCSPAR